MRLATSDEQDAHETLAAYRLRSKPSALVTVAMAYEGLDAPEVAVVAALTQIRSRPWHIRDSPDERPIRPTRG